MTFQFQVSRLRFCHHFEPFYVEFFDFLEPDFHGLILSKIDTKSLELVFLFIAGRNVANPTALLLATAKMLEHLGMQDKGLQVKTAVNSVLEEHKVKTRDLGGFATTSQFTQAVVDHL